MSVVSNSVTPWTVAHQVPLSRGFPRQEYRSGLPFPSPGNVLIYPYFWTTVLLDIYLSWQSFFLQYFILFHCFLASMVSDEKLPININETSLYITWWFSLAAFKILIFYNLTIICFKVNLFESILLEIHWDSWIYRFPCSIKYGKFSAIFSSNILSVPFCFSFLSQILIMYILVYLILSHQSSAAFSFFPFSFQVE